MPDLPAIGLRLHGGLDPRACVELADVAEANGLASVWFAENPFQRGALPTAAASGHADLYGRDGRSKFGSLRPPGGRADRLESVSAVLYRAGGFPGPACGVGSWPGGAGGCAICPLRGAAGSRFGAPHGTGADRRDDGD